MNNKPISQIIPTYQPHQIPPAQLWVGDYEILTESVLQFLQEQFCMHHACRTCKVCLAINNQQYHAITWINPTNAYTLDDLAAVHTTLAFALETDAHHFFIINKADFLTPQCANKLLKSVEEPPPGYHFIFLAQRPEALLPTLRSRCITHHVAGSSPTQPQQKIWLTFTQRKFENAGQFLKDLDAAKINDQDSLDLIDRLLVHWIEQMKEHVRAENSQKLILAQNMVAILKQAMLKPPMPGSSALFWKNLFLQCKDGEH